MRAHIIENGIVTNTIEVESLGFMPNLIDAENGGSIGDLWDGTVFTTPVPDPAEAIKTNKTKAEGLLAATDWSTLPDVTTGSPSLTNQADFISFRNTVRAIVVNPTEVAVFPEIPSSVWS